MSTPYHESQRFDQLDFSAKAFPTGEYEACTFTNGNLANADLGNFKFIDCTFTDCNLSLANLTNTALRNVTFAGCKLIGVRFEACNPFLLAVRFERCILDLTSFYNLKLKGTVFRQCSLQEADFTQADLTSAVFDDCDLASALFGNTVLEKADFRTAFHYALDPELNRVKGARFSSAGLAGLLGKYGLNVD